jgi:hypothetical protein
MLIFVNQGSLHVCVSHNALRARYEDGTKKPCAMKLRLIIAKARAFQGFR